MTITLRKLKRNEKKGKKKIIFYLLANARITKFTAAFNTKIVSFWIKLPSEKADRMYRFFFIGLVDFSPIEAENSIVIFGRRTDQQPILTSRFIS